MQSRFGTARRGFTNTGERVRETFNKQLTKFKQDREQFKLLRNMTTFLLVIALAFVALSTVVLSLVYGITVWKNEVYPKHVWFWVGWAFTTVAVLVALIINHFIFPKFINRARDARRDYLDKLVAEAAFRDTGLAETTRGEMEQHRVDCEAAKETARAWGWGLLAMIVLAFLSSLLGQFGFGLFHMMCGGAYADAISGTYCPLQLDPLFPYVLDTSQGFDASCYSPIEFVDVLIQTIAGGVILGLSIICLVLVFVMQGLLSARCNPITTKMSDADIVSNLMPRSARLA